jgi:hypothetical protein
MVGVSSRMSCRQLFKELNILPVALLFILEVTCFIRKYCQSILIFISIIHERRWISKPDNTKQKYTKSVINIGTKIHNNLPGFINEIENYNTFKK